MISVEAEGFLEAIKVRHLGRDKVGEIELHFVVTGVNDHIADRLTKIFNTCEKCRFTLEGKE